MACTGGYDWGPWSTTAQHSPSINATLPATSWVSVSCSAGSATGCISDNVLGSGYSLGAAGSRPSPSACGSPCP